MAKFDDFMTGKYAERSPTDDLKLASSGPLCDAPRIHRSQVSQNFSKENKSEVRASKCSKEKQSEKLPGIVNLQDCNDHNLDIKNPAEVNIHESTSLNTNQQKRRGSESLDCYQDDSKEDDAADIDGSNLKTTSAIAFSIEVGNARSQKLPPKRLRNQAHGRKQECVSAESIEAKLEMAEMRRKQQEEARIRRIHARQEAARKLAHNVQILLEHRALATGNIPSREADKRMSSRELLATAKQAASNFNYLSHRMESDFAIVNETYTRANVAQKSSCLQGHSSSKGSCDQNQNISSVTTTGKTTSISQAKGSIAFMIGFQEPTNAVENSVCHKLKTPVKHKARANLTVKDIEEKQRKAEERRNTRRQERVKRVVANREALFRLASNLDAFVSIQDSDNVSSKREAARLADEIADSFDRLSQKHKNILKQAEGFSCQTWFHKV